MLPDAQIDEEARDRASHQSMPLQAAAPDPFDFTDFLEIHGAILPGCVWGARIQAVRKLQHNTTGRTVEVNKRPPGVGCAAWAPAAAAAARFLALGWASPP